MSLITVTAVYPELEQLFVHYFQTECPDEPWSLLLERQKLRDIRDVLEAVLMDEDRMGFCDPAELRQRIDTVLETEPWTDALREDLESLAVALSMKADSYIQYNEFLAIVPIASNGTLMLVIAPYD